MRESANGDRVAVSCWYGSGERARGSGKGDRVADFVHVYVHSCLCASACDEREVVGLVLPSWRVIRRSGGTWIACPRTRVRCWGSWTKARLVVVAVACEGLRCTHVM